MDYIDLPSNNNSRTSSIDRNIKNNSDDEFIKIKNKKKGGILKATMDILNKSSRLKHDDSIRSINSKKSLNTSITGDSWRDKYFKVKKDLEDKKSELVKERQKASDLSAKNKLMIKKEENYDKLMSDYKDLGNKLNKLVKKFEESEFIRKEQNKLIKSLQNEIDLLRGNFEERTMKPIQLQSETKTKVKKTSTKSKSKEKKIIKKLLL